MTVAQGGADSSEISGRRVPQTRLLPWASGLFCSLSGFSLPCTTRMTFEKNFTTGKPVLLCAHLSLSEGTSPAFCLLSSQLFSEFRQKDKNWLPLRLERCRSYHLRCEALTLFHVEHSTLRAPSQREGQHVAHPMDLPSWVASGLSVRHAAGDQMLLNSLSGPTTCWVCTWLGACLTRPPGSCQSSEQQAFND